MNFLFPQFDPARPLNWRSEVVESILTQGPHAQPSRQHDDELVWRYYRYRMGLRAAHSEFQSKQVQMRMPDMYLALRIRDDNIAERRLAVQCLLLGRLSNEEVAQHLGTVPEAIDMFEGLFFNIRDRIDNDVWLLRTITGGHDARFDVHDTVSIETEFTTLQMLAYIGGPDVARHVARRAAVRDFPTQGSLSSWLESTSMNIVQLRALAAASNHRLNKFNTYDAINSEARYGEMRQRDRLATDTSADSSNIYAMAKLVEISEALENTLGRSVMQNYPEAVQKAMRTAVEVRPKHRLQSALAPDIQHLTDNPIHVASQSEIEAETRDAQTATQ